MQPRRRRSGSAALHVGLASLLLFAPGRSAHAKVDFDADPAPIDLSRRAIELGSGFDVRLHEPRGEPGSCVQDIGTEREESAATHYSIAALSRVGGRLVIGVHVGTQVAVESLASPRMTDAARRLAGSDAAAFRDLCGDGFVAARALGGQWLAELEVQGADAVRAFTRLETGTWSDPVPFRAVLERLAASGGVTAREIPKGRRAAARALTPSDVIEQALGFPATIPADAATPYYAIFAPYSEAALSGMTLPSAEEIEAADLARLAFRGEATSERSNAAARAAEMRKAVVQREPQDFRTVRGDGSSNAPVSEAPVATPIPVEIVAAEPPAVVEAPPAAAAAASAEGEAVLHKMAALVYAVEGAPPVYATTSAPAGLYAERVRQRSYWVPGAVEASAAVRTAIEQAKTATPSRGTTVVVVERSGGPPVVLTDAPPIEGTFAAPAGERHAWMPGVSAPDAAQRAAIDAAVAAAP